MYFRAIILAALVTGSALAGAVTNGNNSGKGNVCNGGVITDEVNIFTRGDKV